MAKKSIETDVAPRGLSGTGGVRAPVEITNTPIGQSLAGLESVGADAQAIARDLTAATIERDTANMIKGEVAFKQSVAGQIEKLDRLAPDYQKQVDDVLAAAKREALDGTSLTTRGARVEYDARLSKLVGDNKMASITAQRNSIQEEAVRVYDTAYNAVGKDIRKNPDSMEAILAAWKPDSDRLLSGVSTDIKARLEHKLKSDSIALQALGYADRGQFKRAKEVVDNNAGSLDRAQEQKVTYQIQAIQNRMEADSAKYSAQVTSDLSAKLYDWQANPDPTAEPPISRQQLENMRAKGMFANAPHHFTSLVHQLHSVTAQRETAMASTKAAVLAMNTNTIKDQTQADLAWNYQQNGLTGKTKVPANPLDEAQVNAAVQFAQSTGFIPPTFRNYVNNVSQQSGPGDTSEGAVAKLAGAVMLFDKFGQAAPNIKWGGSADDKNNPVAVASQLIREENISPMEAARRAIALTPKDKETTVLRGKDFTEEVLKLKGPSVKKEDFMASQAMEPFKSFIRGVNPFEKNLTTTPEVAAAYERRFQAAYVATGDMNTAKGVAQKWAAQNFSVTNVGADQNVVTQFAPEHFVPPQLQKGMPADTASRIFNDEIQTALKAAGMDADPTKYRLRADSQTEQEANAFMATGGGTVSYRLQVADSYGNFVDVNGPRWRTLTPDEIVKNAHYVKAMQESIDSFNKKRGLTQFGEQQQTEADEGVKDLGRRILKRAEDIFAPPGSWRPREKK